MLYIITFTCILSLSLRMFGVPLEDLIVNNQLPERLQEMLIRLWVDGPTTSGIFRLNGNARKMRELREAIDGSKGERERLGLYTVISFFPPLGKAVDVADESIHVISSLLKVRMIQYSVHSFILSSLSLRIY